MDVQILDCSSVVWLETLEHLRHDIYHRPGYLALEASRIEATAAAILITEKQQQFFLPYLVRSCDRLLENESGESPVFDLISPYGYPGILLSDAAWESTFIQQAFTMMIEKFKGMGICSAFLRLHPILNQNFDQIYPGLGLQLTGETIAVDLTLSDAEIWQQTRSEHRNKINRCKRQGFVARMVEPALFIEKFNEIYEETMDRVLASQSYYFGLEYLFGLLRAWEKHLHLCIVELNEQVVCAGLFTSCGGMVQYHLGGTKGGYLKQAPSKLMFDHVRYWAKQQGNTLFHLGGGVGGAADSLYHFKAGFSRQRYQFSTLRLILNETLYTEMVELRARQLGTNLCKLRETSFFPAYRCSVMPVASP
ncbi:hypothetical protein DO97_09180 [Neosynechococcus sphagnicola sy1]|uniref:BioF2-like acetyltransferase domain-containing protein n=1 Tax=Neosynechococcus sphagnicola sy1 TaxID=1497020 RepID=A0A098TII3_9CYAN|nr:GNAT family N-acetyltransferase [Neosynechococcus sphagnicola]KGF72375.1 hypothetical protein DO97_09180 [Neosynechococcus sphagnicola sy1]